MWASGEKNRRRIKNYRNQGEFPVFPDFNDLIVLFQRGAGAHPRHRAGGRTVWRSNAFIARLNGETAVGLGIPEAGRNLAPSGSVEPSNSGTEKRSSSPLPPGMKTQHLFRPVPVYQEFHSRGSGIPHHPAASPRRIMPLPFLRNNRTTLISARPTDIGHIDLLSSSRSSGFTFSNADHAGTDALHRPHR